MYKLTTPLLHAIQSTYQTGSDAPNILIEIYKRDGKGGYNMAMPHSIRQDIVSVNISVRVSSGANDCTVTLSNTDGAYSPDYRWDKKYRGVSEGLPISAFGGVIAPRNLVHIYMGYGNELVRKFTGYISNPQTNEKGQTIQFDVLDEYTRLQKPVDPINVQRLAYRDQRASFIIEDLLTRAGVKNFVIDMTSVEKKDFSVNEFLVDLGTNYDAAIKKLLDIMSHSIKADRFGALRVEEVKIPDSMARPDIELSDYLNLTEGQLYIDDTVIRNKIIVQGAAAWKAYKDDFLLEYMNMEKIVMAIDVPWAETETEMKQAADFYFMQMRRKFKTMTVATFGNPCIDCGDTATLEAWVSAITDKYVINSVETSFDSGAYTERLELEQIVKEESVAVDAGGEYAPYETDVSEEGEEARELTTGEPTIQDKVINTAKGYLDTWYQAGGDKYGGNGYGFDSSHFIFACLNTNGVKNFYEDLPTLMAGATEITEDERLAGDLIFYVNANGKPTNAAIYIGGGQVIGMFNASPDITDEGAARLLNARCMVSRVEGAVSYRRIDWGAAKEYKPLDNT